MLTSMIKFFFLFLFSMFLFTKNTVAQDSIVFTGKMFDSARVFYKQKDVPKYIWEKVFNGSRRGIFIADTGASYNEGDVANSDPDERIIFIIKTNGNYILFYERGGWTQARICCFIGIKDNAVEKILRLDVPYDVSTYKELERILVGGEYHIIHREN